MAGKEQIEMIEVRDKYIDSIKKELLGPGSEISIPDQEHELISNSPERQYSIGILFPRENSLNAENDDTVRIDDGEVTENENDPETDEAVEKPVLETKPTISAGDEENLDEEISLAAQNMPSSMGITFFVRGNVNRINCTVDFGTYRKAVASDCRIPLQVENPDTYEVLPELSAWFSYDKDEKTLRLDKGGLNNKIVRDLAERLDSDPDGIIDKMYKLSNQLRRGWVRIPHKAVETVLFGKEDYIDENSCIEGSALKITALRRRIKDDLYSVTLMLVNDSKETISGKTCIFQPMLSVETDDNEFVFETYSSVHDMETMDDEEKMLELQYRNKNVYATGLGVSADWEINESGEGRLFTEWFPKEEVPSMDFNMPEWAETDKQTFAMKYLSDFDLSSKNEKIEKLKVFISDYKCWIDELKKKSVNVDKSFASVSEKVIADCTESFCRMQSGIETLEKDDLAWDAFQLANRAMYMQRIHSVLQSKTAYRDRYDEDKELLDLITAIRSDYKKADDIDLLKNDPYSWRPFQLAFLIMSINSIILEDSEDRELVDLIWFPTGGGKTEAYLGLTAFTIFFRRLKYPGEAGGTTVIMRYTLRLLAAQQFTRASTLICACELIRQDATSRRPRYGAYELGKEQITIGLWIGGEHTPNTNHKAKEELSELMNANVRNLKYAKEAHNKFQVLKCPWCGTKLVKDLASDGKGLLGNFGYRMNRKKQFQLYCTNQDCDFTDLLPIQIVDEELYSNPPTLLFGTVDKFAMMPWRKETGAFFGIGRADRAPELIIQDELHLISGPLGTIVGLYETAVNELCKIKGNSCKIVASTATIRRAKEQCAALYNRTVKQFPSPGIDAEDSFFAREAEIDYAKGKYGRMYVGLLPSGKTKAMMEVRSIASLMQRINTFDISDYIKDKYWTLTVYFNSLKDLGKCSTLVSDDVISHIRTMASRTGRPSEGRRISRVDELTSRVSTTELNETLEKLEKREYSKDDDNKNVSGILLATNMISVGIDVARLNTMLMVGQPKLTSEYIQASSRVGRSFPGVCFALYDSSKSRDRSHYEQFKSYHESFYKHVEPTGATPFSKPARDRALHAIAIAIIRNLVPELSDDESAGNFDLEKYAKEVEYIENVISQRSDMISQRLYDEYEDETGEIKEEIRRVFETWEAQAKRFKEGNFSYGNKYMQKGPDEGKGRLMKVFNTFPNDNGPLDTMTSMRNIDSTVAGNIIIWE